MLILGGALDTEVNVMYLIFKTFFGFVFPKILSLVNLFGLNLPFVSRKFFTVYSVSLTCFYLFNLAP